MPRRKVRPTQRSILARLRGNQPENGGFKLSDCTAAILHTRSRQPVVGAGRTAAGSSSARSSPVSPTQQQGESQRSDQEKRSSADPVFDQAYACPQKVAERDDRRGPHGSAQDIVEGELSPAHLACAGDQGAED